MEEIIDEYDKEKSRYELFTKSIKSLIENLLLSNEVAVHSTSSRVKDRRSLELKIEEKETYESLSDITDISGVRVITYYSDQVDVISGLIKDEFSVDEKNSVNKKDKLGVDRFGYISLHYIISINSARENLTEYRNFKGLKAELQIRSILQHTWAEIEHDIGYKSELSIPDKVRRKFSRLASTLEGADEDFIDIREELIGYKENVINKINNNDIKIPVDTETLKEYLNKSEVVKRIVDEAKRSSAFGFTRYTKGNLDRMIRVLDYASIKTIEDFEKKLGIYSIDILKKCSSVSKQREENERTPPLIAREIICSYLVQAMVSESNNIQDAINYYKHIRGERDTNTSAARAMLKVFN